MSGLICMAIGCSIGDLIWSYSTGEHASLLPGIWDLVFAMWVATMYERWRKKRL